ncbi:hypothetical protein ACFE04_015902 [Oxalis oulophora]
MVTVRIDRGIRSNNLFDMKEVLNIVACYTKECLQDFLANFLSALLSYRGQTYIKSKANFIIVDLTFPLLPSLITGTCQWKTPIYETVKFLKDPKTGKIKDKLYHFVVSTGVTKSCVLGAASIDFAEYFNSNKASTVSLPIKYSKSEALLHVSNGTEAATECQFESLITITFAVMWTKVKIKKPEKRNGSLKSHFRNDNNDMEGNIIRNSIQIDGQVMKTTQNAEINFNNGASRLSCRTIINSDNSSELDTPRELGTRSFGWCCARVTIREFARFEDKEHDDRDEDLDFRAVENRFVKIDSFEGRPIMLLFSTVTEYRHKDIAVWFQALFVL